MKRGCREEENFIGNEGTEKRTMNDERQERLRRQREYMRRGWATLTYLQRETILQQRRNLISQPSLRHCHVFIRHNSPRPFVCFSRDHTQIACPNYPESKDRVPKSFSFIPCAWVFRLAPRCCMHLSSNKDIILILGYNYN